MLQLHKEPVDLFDSILPEELRKLPEELARVDELLSDPRFMEPFLKRFNTTTGRPTVPVAVYLRLMYLKFRHKLGYETVVAEVNDSFTWRRFCGIGFQQKMPDSTTLIKLTHKYGEETLEALHQLLITNLKERKIVRGRKIRLDGTVVAADVHYPTDMSLMADGLRRMRQGLRSVPGLGLRLGRTLKRAKSLIFSAHRGLRGGGEAARERIKRFNRKIMAMTRRAAEKVKAILHRVKAPHIRRRMEETLSLTDRIIEQTGARLKGEKIQDRLISLADPEARAIVKGKLDKPVEFGRTSQVVQDESGYFTQAKVFNGNPNEAPLLPDLIAEHQKQFPGALNAVAADTAYGSEDNRSCLKKAKVRWIGIPWRGHPPPAALAQFKRTWFKKLYAFRAGIEAGFRFLDRKFGFKRSMFRGTPGTKIWAIWCLLAANLYRFGQGP
jgi:IS5 family transposase